MLYWTWHFSAFILWRDVSIFIVPGFRTWAYFLPFRLSGFYGRTISAKQEKILLSLHSQTDRLQRARKQKLEQTGEEINSMSWGNIHFPFALPIVHWSEHVFRTSSVFVFEVNLPCKCTNAWKSALNHPSTTKYKEERTVLSFRL